MDAVFRREVFSSERFEVEVPVVFIVTGAIGNGYGPGGFRTVLHSAVEWGKGNSQYSL